MAAPTPALIRAQIAAVLAQPSDARVAGISVPTPPDVADTLHVGDCDVAVTYSDSVLEIRERIAARSPAEPPLVLLTPLDEMELGADVVAQLIRKRLFAVEPWQLVKERFQARWIDPRLVERHAWVAPKLLEWEPQGGYSPAPSGFLDADTAWKILFEGMLGLPGGQRDPVSLLDWAADEAARDRLGTLTAAEREDLAEAVEDSAGPLSKRIFECACGEHGADALSVGLVARVLFGEGARSDVEAGKAAVRLERHVGGRLLEDAVAAGWADAAEAVVERRIARDGIADVRPLIDAADRLLRDELHAEAAAHRSRVLRLGYVAHQRSFAAELQTLIEGGATEVPPELWEIAARVEGHVLAAYDKGRCERMRMALRLAGWLANRRRTAGTAPRSFAEAARAYRSDVGFADWARAEVWDGDSTVPEMVGAYTALSEAVGAGREAFNERFGTSFANWTATGSHDDSITLVEDVLRRVVAPLAQQRPVLLAVIDGMGMAVFRELEQDLTEQGWIQLAAEGEAASAPVVSAVPSVTEVSRTSLLSGALVSGTQVDELKAFVKHPGLLEASAAGKPPVLFHKGNLTEPGRAGLAPTVAEALTDPKQRVVGVVINAVDDHLAKGGQIRVPWRVESIRPLGGVLSAALESGRIVVVVSDHGHVPEHHTELLEGGEAERWRHVGSPPGEPRRGELLIQGPRVVLGQDGKLIAPWSESIRFTPKKNGYHGGLSPQEIVIPLGIFSSGGTPPEGWVEVPKELPAWWEREAAAVPEAPKTEAPRTTSRGRGKAKAPEGQPLLFEEGVAAVAPAKTAIAGAPAHWIEDLLASEAMTAQRQQAARTALSDERIRAVLGALDQRGGKLTRTALANQLSLPALRIGGVLSALRRLLNVDGYAVLSVDEASDTVELNRELLFIQFGLKR